MGGASRGVAPDLIPEPRTVGTPASRGLFRPCVCCGRGHARPTLVSLWPTPAEVVGGLAVGPAARRRRR